DLGRLALDLPGRLQPGQVRHPHVEDRQVGPLADRQVARLGAVGGLGYDLDVRLAFEQQAETGADDPVVVGDQDLHRADSPGTIKRTVVPAPGRDSIVSSPPTSSARSRMPAIPRPRWDSSKAKPRPSSETVSSTPPSGSRRSAASARPAPEWRAAVGGAPPAAPQTPSRPPPPRPAGDPAPPHEAP